VTNVTDRIYETTVEDLYNANGTATARFSEPRMYGVSVRYGF
jgi:hypothetical protein